MNSPPQKPEVISMGCRLNLAESNALAEQLAGQEDIVIINSCAVTNESVRQTRQAIRQAHKRRPDARVWVTGCAAQVEPETFQNMPEVAGVFGNHEKQNAALLREIINRPDRPVVVSDIMTIAQTAPHLVTAYAGKTRAFVEVQNGCDHRCTFCIIPYGRGNSRSVPAGSVIEHIKKLVNTGFQEVVLTGVDVTSYGHDLPGQPNLGSLVERILRLVPDLPRLRLSSIDGVEIDARLFDLLTSEARVMPHVHLSLQAGDNMILKRMKRRHSRELAIDLVARLKAKRPDIAIGADIIAGFPTEDDAMFANSVD
ncbi:MAG: MiaB/RimO family radical SAM methylthiotransferase, partial [Sphingomonadaceae bacterium]|nr:MiaB/RimO family radical SAM methylthiotransferase [Sphingomonadaceae bacterium]